MTRQPPRVNVRAATGATAADESAGLDVAPWLVCVVVAVIALTYSAEFTGFVLVSLLR